MSGITIGRQGATAALIGIIGDDFDESLIWENEDRTPFNYTGVTVTAQIVGGPSPVTMSAVFSTVSGETVLRLQIPRATTATMTSACGHWFCVLERAGQQITELRGPVTWSVR